MFVIFCCQHCVIFEVQIGSDQQIYRLFQRETVTLSVCGQQSIVISVQCAVAPKVAASYFHCVRPFQTIFISRVFPKDFKYRSITIDPMSALPYQRKCGLKVRYICIILVKDSPICPWNALAFTRTPGKEKCTFYF